MEFEDKVTRFVELAGKHGVRMLLVGGGAVNFHGYQRHSADVDFWVRVDEENLNRLRLTLNELGYEVDAFPKEIMGGEQNISVKVSPIQELELITAFNPGKTFDEAFADAVEVNIKGMPLVRYRVLSFDDLIESKLRAMRPKDLLDVQELKRRKG
jgi:predicted nucleotidyltransferase component of viral defense system